MKSGILTNEEIHDISQELVENLRELTNGTRTTTFLLLQEGWKNEEFDKLIDLAAEANEEDRYKLLGQAETILLDSCMVIPIHHPIITNVIDKNVCGGWSENAFDIHPLKYLNKKVEKSTVPNIVLK